MRATHQHTLSMRAILSSLCLLSLSAAAAPVTAPWLAPRGGVSSVASLLPLGGLSLRTAAAGAAAPPPPFWPLEWRAELAQLNTTSNKTAAFTSSYSIAHQGALNDFHPPPPSVYLHVQLYDDHLEAAVSGIAPGGVSCSEAYLPGTLQVPPVQTFAFIGPGEFDGRAVWLWEQAPLAYATEQTAQQMPVAILNGETHIVTAWGPTTIFSNASWPQGYWAKPAACA